VASNFRVETYDAETDTFITEVTEVPEPSEKDHFCQYHPTVKWDWHTNGRGKKVMGCPVCSGIRTTQQGITGPLHLYKDATYWRQRELSDKEKQHPPRRGT